MLQSLDTFQLTLEQRLEGYKWALANFDVITNGPHLCVVLGIYLRGERPQLFDKFVTYLKEQRERNGGCGFQHYGQRATLLLFPEFAAHKPSGISDPEGAWWEEDGDGNEQRAIVLRECIHEVELKITKEQLRRQPEPIITPISDTLTVLGNINTNPDGSISISDPNS